MTKNFVLSGKAVFTLKAPSGARYAFRITRKNANYSTNLPKHKDCVYYLSTMPDKSNVFAYTGVIAPKEGGLIHTPESQFARNSKHYRVAVFVLGIIWGLRELPDGYSLSPGVR